MSDTERMREACAKLAEEAFADVRTFASENSDRYIGMRDAGRNIAAGIRALAVPEQAPERLGPFENPDDLIAALDAPETCHSCGGPLDTFCASCEQVAPAAWKVVPADAAPAALPDGKDAERDALIAEFVRWWLDDEMDGAAYFNNVMRASPAAAKAMAAAIQAQTEGERAPSPASASAVPQGGDAAANQGGER